MDSIEMCRHYSHTLYRWDPYHPLEPGQAQQDTSQIAERLTYHPLVRHQRDSKEYRVPQRHLGSHR